VNLFRFPSQEFLNHGIARLVAVRLPVGLRAIRPVREGSRHEGSLQS